MEENPTQYYKHYLSTDGAGRITDGWSDGPCPGQDTDGAVLLREDGGYPFRLFPGGEENPALLDEAGAHLWRWEGAVRASTEEELEAERAGLLAGNVPLWETL